MRVTVDDDKTNNEMIAELYVKIDNLTRQLRDLEMYVFTGVRADAMNSKPAQELAPQYEPKMRAAYDETKQKRENAK